MEFSGVKQQIGKLVMLNDTNKLEPTGNQILTYTLYLCDVLGHLPDLCVGMCLPLHSDWFVFYIDCILTYIDLCIL